MLGSPGLLDPCEKETKDVLDNLTSQEREDLTSHAQRALRLIAFRQVHQVLDMEQIVPTKFIAGRGKKRSGGSGNPGVNGSSEPSAKAAKLDNNTQQDVTKKEN